MNYLTLDGGKKRRAKKKATKKAPAKKRTTKKRRSTKKWPNFIYIKNFSKQEMFEEKFFFFNKLIEDF